MQEIYNQILLFINKETIVDPASIYHNVPGSTIKNLVYLKQDNLLFPEVSGRYRLTPLGRECCENRLVEFENKPYDYYLWSHQKESQETATRRYHEAENARLQFETFSLTKKIAIWALIVTIIALVVSVIQLFQKP